MKKIYSIFTLILLLTALGCSSSDNNEGVMVPDPTDDGNNGNDPDPGSISYAADIRPIIQSNCVSCHGDPPTNSAPMKLTTLDDLKDAAENRGLLGRLNSSTNPMPPSGMLPAATRKLIEDWIDLGFPE